jgi:uncharacterized protein with PIN domain
LDDAFPASARPCFVVDASAIKLGHYLRCLGYDAEWDERAATRELARRADREGRVLLTRFTRLDEEAPRPKRCVELRSEDPLEQLGQVVGECGLDVRRWLFSRCIRCNVELERVRSRESVRARVPAGVLRRFETFFTCPRCATVFWHGTHVANTCRKLGIEPPGEARGT